MDSEPHYQVHIEHDEKDDYTYIGQTDAEDIEEAIEEVKDSVGPNFTITLTELEEDNEYC